MGYHLKPIPKGVLGEASKIVEECAELQDAVKQGNKVLQICELCDIVGAVEAYASSFNLTLADIIKMKDATKSAFESGERT
jgi:NTP pyrophosphatase (non-canonical NTP hydrolase)